MNDRIKQLLATAEQSDAIAKNKWRIENREQLRKERKEKLKELMEKDQQQNISKIPETNTTAFFAINYAYSKKLLTDQQLIREMLLKEIKTACQAQGYKLLEIKIEKL